MRNSHLALTHGLSIKGFSVEDMGITSPLRWKAVAFEAGFRDVLLCGRNEQDESSVICREILARLPLPPVATEREMRRSDRLYTVLGKHRNYLVVSINQPDPLLGEATGDVSVVPLMRDGEGREVLPVVQPVE